MTPRALQGSTVESAEFETADTSGWGLVWWGGMMGTCLDLCSKHVCL